MGESPRRVERFRAVMEEAERTGQRAWSVPEPATGVATPAKERTGRALRWTSKDEDRVRAYLLELGHPVVRVTHTVPDLMAGGGTTWEANPDLTIGPVVIEVDSPARRGGGPSHDTTFPAQDLYRADCFRAAGLRVLHVRLGGLPPVPEVHNVCRDGALTTAVLEAVAAGVQHLLDGGTPSICTIAAPTPRKRSVSNEPLGAIREDKYIPGGFTFTWGYEQPRTRYYLLADGRFLYGAGPGWSLTFLKEVSLDVVARTKWRSRLFDVMAEPSDEADLGPFDPAAHHELPFAHTEDGDYRLYPTAKHDPRVLTGSWTVREAPGATIRHERDRLVSMDEKGEEIETFPLNPGVFDLGYTMGAVEHHRARRDCILYAQFRLPERRPEGHRAEPTNPLDGEGVHEEG